MFPIVQHQAAVITAQVRRITAAPGGSQAPRPLSRWRGQRIELCFVTASMTSARKRSGKRSRRPIGRRAARKGGISPTRLLTLLAARDLDALIDAAFGLLTEAVPCDFVIAFYGKSDTGLLRERDSRGREYGQAFIRRHNELSSALPLARAQPGVEVLTTRAGLPRSEETLKKSPFYREIMQPQGVRHAVALCFWSEPPGDLPLFVLSIARGDGRDDFLDADVIAAKATHPFISSAVTRLLESEASQSVRDAMGMTIRNRALGVAVLDWNLCLIEADPAARRICASWADDAGRTRVHRSRRSWRLPPELATACREMQSEWHAQPPAPGKNAVFRHRSRVPHPHLLGVAASITMICPNATSLSEPSFVIEVARIEKPEHAALVLQRLTAAEREVAMVMVDGLSNQEIADQLGKSVHAVKFLLHRIYSKAGVPNRAALVAALRAGNVTAE